jgi:hypothetical protein
MNGENTNITVAFSAATLAAASACPEIHGGSFKMNCLEAIPDVKV